MTREEDQAGEVAVQETGLEASDLPLSPDDLDDDDLDDDDLDDDDLDDDNDDQPGQTHVLLRTVVLPNRKIVFVPTLKAGCTSLLWMLARLAGLSVSRFERSTLPAVSPEMTIHTMSAWPAKYRWRDLSESRREEIATDDSWVRFTTVRDPATRLWSAWQSKLLLREPGFSRRFGDEPWFPRIPQRPSDIVEDFRKFVHALASQGAPFDLHWGRQADIISAAPPLTHIGRIESMDDTVAILAAHVGPGWNRVTGAQKNRSLLPYHRGLYDAATAEIVNSYYADDIAQFDYRPLAPDDAPGLDEWGQTAAHRLDAVAALCACHQRVDTLHKQASRAERDDDELKRLRTENARLESWIDAAAQARKTAH